MGLLRNQLSRRLRTVGLLSDIAMVGAAGLRVARRSKSPTTGRADPREWMLVAGAAYRLLRRLRRARRARRTAATVVD